MATETLWPVSDAVDSDWVDIPNNGECWDNLDEDPHDGGSTYIDAKTFDLYFERNALFNPSSHSIPGGATINKVTVGIYSQNTGTGGPYISLKVRLSAQDSTGSSFQPAVGTWTQYTQDFTEKPGGGSWAVSDIANIDFGVYLEQASKTQWVEVTNCWLTVDYTEDAPETHTLGYPLNISSQSDKELWENFPFYTDGTPYAAKDIETDRQTNPTNCSDDPLFTAIPDFENDSRTAEYIQIQVGTERYGADVWDSGWVAITSTADGVRCEEISYGGSTVLGSGRTYYVQIRFKDDLGVAGAWSPELATFAGVVSEWWDSNYIFREKVQWPTHHDAIPQGATCVLEHQTGLRDVVGTDGFFDEGVDFARHEILYHKGKTHIVYLSRLDKTGASPDLNIMVVTKDHYTGQWGTPTKIGDSGTNYDTHYFPSICVTPNDDKLHVFGACHNSNLKYWRSVNANDSSSWTTVANLAGMVSYPHAFVLPNNRIYVFARGATALENVKASFIYSTNGGTSWSSWLPFCYNTETDAARVYLFGVRMDYDHVPWRLHMCMDFTIQPVGQEGYTDCTLYAYSDYDSGEDEGFHDWYTHNDDITGVTGYTNSLIRKWDGDPTYTADIIWETTYGQRDAKGCLYCYLDPDRNPQVILEAKPWGNDRWHHTLGMAKINGSTWSINWFGKTLDIDVWHARQGAVAMVDENNIIHLFAIMCPKRYSINLPTGNGNYTQWTKSDSGQEYYEHVDDDRIDLDESTYLSTTTEAQKCSFTFSFDLPENTTILGVDVSYFAKRVGSGSPTVKTFLRISSTDYEQTGTQALDGYHFSTTWPTSGHGEYHYTWNQNPATSSDWQESDLTGLEVGIKYEDDDGGAQTIQLARVQCRVLIMQSGHQRWFAGTLVEFFSDDNGTTWSYRLLSGYAAFGLPIINMKERYTNRQIELMYVCGNSIMYYLPKAWGIMRLDGRDCRLVYDGNEIDRVALDYWNLNSSQIAFAAPAAVPAHAQYTPKNLYLYYGNPHAGVPLNNPANVFTFYEGFELYAHGTSINGVNGWSVESGTATVYQASRWLGSALYTHNNKVYAGLQSLSLSSTASVSRVLGVEVTNIEIEASIWMEAASGYQTYMEVEDLEGTTFAVGLTGSTDYGIYYDGSWHNSSVRGTPQNQYVVKIRITPDGVSAWFRDELIVDENSMMTSANILRLVTDSAQSYFDHVIVRQYIANPGTLTVDATEYHGCYFDATIVGQGKLQNIYDSKIDGYRYFQSAHQHIDTGSGRSEPELLPCNTRQGYAIPDTLPVSSEQRRLLPGTLPISTYQLYDALAHFCVASEQCSAIDDYMPVDTGAILDVQSTLGIYAGTTATVAYRLDISSLPGRAIQMVAPISARGGAAIPATLPIDMLGRYNIPQLMPVEQLAGAHIVCLFPIASNLRKQIADILPIYTGGQQTQECAIILPIDTLAAYDVATLSSIYTQQVGEVDATLPLSAGTRNNVSVVLPSNANRAIALAATIPISSEGIRVVAVPIAVNSQQTQYIYCTIPINARSGNAIAAPLSYYLQSVNEVDLITAINTSLAQATPGVLPVASAARADIPAYFPFDSLGQELMDVAIILPINTSSVNEIPATVPVETQANLQLAMMGMVDAAKGLGIDITMPGYSRSGANIAITMAVNTGKRDDLGVMLQVENLQQQSGPQIFISYESLQQAAVQWMLPYYDVGHLAAILALQIVDTGAYCLDITALGNYKIDIDDAGNYRIDIQDISDEEAI